MPFNWVAFATKLPGIIQIAMAVQQNIRDKKGAEKKKAVIEAIPTSVLLAEFALGKDIIKDPVVAQLISAYIDAEAAAMKAKAALKEGILVKQPVN